jgi:chlorophyllide a reductase subunit X
MGGSTRLLGLVINRDDGSGVAEHFAQQVGLPVLLKIPLSRQIREMADACQLALVDSEFDALFTGLAQQIMTHMTPPVTMEQVTPLDYNDFLAVFGAAEPDIVPDGASAAELFGSATDVRPLPVIGLEAVPVGNQPDMDPPTQHVVTRLLQELGMYVTEANHDPKKGLVLTVDGNATICFGSDQELDSKIAILAALQKSGEAYRYIDLRRPASPLYR